jgi:hypothetical protein
LRHRQLELFAEPLAVLTASAFVDARHNSIVLTALVLRQRFTVNWDID